MYGKSTDSLRIRLHHKTFVLNLHPVLLNTSGEEQSANTKHTDKRSELQLQAPQVLHGSHVWIMGYMDLKLGNHSSGELPFVVPALNTKHL